MAIANFTVYRVYKWEFNSKKEIKIILPTGDGPFLNTLIYYMNIAKKRHRNPCFWENCLIMVKKCIIPKTKVVPKTLRYCKTYEKIKFSKYIIFGGISGVPKWAKKLKMT